MMLYLTFSSLLLQLSVSLAKALPADRLKESLDRCSADEDCLGANRVCSSKDLGSLSGRCVCKEGFVQSLQGFACLREADAALYNQARCETDEDCDRNEVCMSWQYDPALEYARKLRTRLSPGGDQPELHKFCIDAWIIYNQHLEELDEPRTGGGLRSNRRYFDAEEYFFNQRGRPPRTREQYIGFGEDMMLTLFLVCILATLVTVHRGACYRQLQDARRNTPLRHFLPIPEDRPPPYTARTPDSVDNGDAGGCSAGPKPLTEAPPPSYEEALARQTNVAEAEVEYIVVQPWEETSNTPNAEESQATVEEEAQPVIEVSEEQDQQQQQQEEEQEEALISESSERDTNVTIESGHEQKSRDIEDNNEVEVEQPKVEENDQKDSSSS